MYYSAPEDEDFFLEKKKRERFRLMKGNISRDKKFLGPRMIRVISLLRLGITNEQDLTSPGLNFLC